MRIRTTLLIMAAVVLLATGCAGDNYNQQRGAVLGAAYGAAAGAIIGDKPESAWIGGALGGVAGSAIGNYYDKQYQEQRSYWRSAPRYSAPQPAPAPSQGTAYPRASGNWVTVPGQHVGREYVPPHEVYIERRPRGIVVNR